MYMIFLTTQGLDSGFSGGSDDLYNVYDKPWRAGGGMADKIYRPSKAMDKDIYGDDVEKLIKTSNKWVVVLRELSKAIRLYIRGKYIVHCSSWHTNVCVFYPGSAVHSMHDIVQ